MQVRVLQRNPNQRDRIISFENFCKVYFSMIFGAPEQGVPLPITFLIHMKKFLDNYKKQVASKKKEEAVDESNPDPLTFPLYCLVVNWFIHEKNLSNFNGITWPDQY